MISNLRWLLLFGVAIVIILDAKHGLSGPRFSVLLVLLLAAALYNLAVMFLLVYGTFRHPLPSITLGMDAALAVSFIAASGGTSSPLLFFGLFPVITGALRFSWQSSLLTAILITVSYALLGYIHLPPEAPLTSLYPLGVNVLILLLAAIVSGLVGGQVKRIVARTQQLQEAEGLQQLRAAHERFRVIFELASTLSATLNYRRVLEAVLDVSEAGLRELVQSSSPQVSMVLLFSEKELLVAASRHLTRHDHQVRLPGQQGVIAEALATAEPAITDDPGRDPELGQFVPLHRCRQAIAVPLRAGFENFGVVVFGSPTPGAYTADCQDLLIAICNQAIMALQNAQLFQSLREEKERIVDVEEDARKKLARDLHDGPTQSIAAIAMRLNYARMLLDRDPARVKEELQHAEELARRTTKEIRQMLFTLRPLILETQGLRAALEEYIRKRAETDPFPVYLEAEEGVDQRLDRDTQGALFYIVEEAITNARKHAQPQNIWVRLYVQDNSFVAEVEDDGIGFEMTDVQMRYDQRGSLGLVNMRERTELIGGTLRILSALDQGTRVTLTVPLTRGARGA